MLFSQAPLPARHGRIITSWLDVMGFDPEIVGVLGCQQCTFNRYMPSWSFFIFLRLGAVCWVSWGRLDWVRSVGIAAGLEFAYFHLWTRDVIAGYREIFGVSRSPIEVFGQWFANLFALGVIHLILMMVFSRFSFFRERGLQKFDRRKLILIVPVFLMIGVVQMAVSSGTSPH